MAVSEVNLEQLIGQRVLALNGHSAGRLEEVIAVAHGQSLVVEEYRIGRYALLDRFSVWPIGRALLRFARSRSGYRIPWNKLDISDPARPRLTCPVEELEEQYD